jgi:hypothetical protein
VQLSWGDDAKAIVIVLRRNVNDLECQVEGTAYNRVGGEAPVFPQKYYSEPKVSMKLSKAIPDTSVRIRDESDNFCELRRESQSDMLVRTNVGMHRRKLNARSSNSNFSSNTCLAVVVPLQWSAHLEMLRNNLCRITDNQKLPSFFLFP